VRSEGSRRTSHHPVSQHASGPIPLTVLHERTPQLVSTQHY
jgi:hypothetical protein